MNTKNSSKPSSIKSTINKKYHKFIPNTNSIKKLTKLNYNMAKAAYEMTDQIKVIIIVILIIVLVVLFYFLIYKKHNTTKYKTFLDTTKGGVLVPYDFSTSLKIKGTSSTPQSIPARMLNMSYGNTAFTISFWVMINNVQKDWVHLLSYTDGSTDGSTDAVSPQQYPGIWLSPNNNRLSIYLDSQKSTREMTTIENIRMRKWINITCVVDNQAVGLYVDGKLNTSYVIAGTPLILNNTGNIYINNNQFTKNKSNKSNKSNIAKGEIQVALLRVYSGYSNPAEVNNLYELYKPTIDTYTDQQFEKLKYNPITPFTEVDENVKTDMEYIEDNDTYHIADDDNL